MKAILKIMFYWNSNLSFGIKDTQGAIATTDIVSENAI